MNKRQDVSVVARALLHSWRTLGGYGHGRAGQSFGTALWAKLAVLGLLHAALRAEGHVEKTCDNMWKLYHLNTLVFGVGL